MPLIRRIISYFFLLAFPADLDFFMVQESIEYFPIPLRKSLKVIPEGDFLVVQESIFPLPLRKSLKVIPEGDFLECCFYGKSSQHFEEKQGGGGGNFMKIHWQGLKVIFVLGVIVCGFFCLSSPVFAGGLLEGWTGDIFAGYNKSGGNTDKASGSLAAQALKKFEHSQFLIKGSMFYSESENNMDGQKWEALGKYSRDFGKEYNWYNFYQALLDHDYFADIDYRITPAFGIGYHIANTEDWAWDIDTGLGYRITRHRVNSAEDDDALTAIAHTFIKRRIFEKAFLSEDLTVYPGLKNNSGVILRSETAFINPLRDNLDLEVKYIVDYNSEPAGKKKRDTQIVGGIKYKF